MSGLLWEENALTGRFGTGKVLTPKRDGSVLVPDAVDKLYIVDNGGELHGLNLENAGEDENEVQEASPKKERRITDPHRVVLEKEYLGLKKFLCLNYEMAKTRTIYLVAVVARSSISFGFVGDITNSGLMLLPSLEMPLPTEIQWDSGRLWTSPPPRFGHRSAFGRSKRRCAHGRKRTKAFKTDSGPFLSPFPLRCSRRVLRVQNISRTRGGRLWPLLEVFASSGSAAPI